MNQCAISKSESYSFFKKNWHLIALFLIAILSFGLNFYAISKLGFGNAYYAAAIKSMSLSFKNFFYVSFDPAGVVSVDKPPLGLWIQTVFVLIFGYHGWAMLLPQALAATGSCIMMYALISKYFGRPAGLISALVFALTPAVVVAARNNTMDTQLILALLTAAWFLFKSLETGKWRYLFICAVFVGLGFNIKMLQAYMILPGVVIVYLVFAKGKFTKRLIAGAISLVIMAAISFAWVLAVDLTPASERPYVGSSTNNTVTELIIGHNGLERLYGSGGGMGTSHSINIGGLNGGLDYNFNRQNDGQGGQFGSASMQHGSALFGITNPGNNTQTPIHSPDGHKPGDGNMKGGQFGAPGGGNEIGTTGIFRLWSTSLYGQATWLVVLALFCIVVKLRKFDIKNLTVRQGMFIFWIVWLVTMYAFFSFASFWHRYYLCMFAPGIAGLAGIGIPEMVRSFRDKRGWKQILLPLSLLSSFAIEIFYVWSYSALRAWLAPVMIGSAAVSLLLMAFHYIKPKKKIILAAAGFMLIALLSAPFYWSLTAVLYVEQNSTLPYAGPELAASTEVRGMTPNQEVLTTGDSGTLALEKYLVEHYKEGSYLVVSQRANDVAQFIVDTGLPAVAYGGFLGSDNAITLDRLKELVSEGKVTCFMISGQNGNINSELTAYVKQNATLIKPSEYQGTTAVTEGAGESINGISSCALYLFS